MSYRLGLVIQEILRFGFPSLSSLKNAENPKSTVICRTEDLFRKIVIFLESEFYKLQNGTHFNNF